MVIKVMEYFLECGNKIFDDIRAKNGNKNVKKWNIFIYWITLW